MGSPEDRVDAILAQNAIIMHSAMATADRLEELKSLASEMAELLDLHSEWSRVASVLDRWRDFCAQEAIPVVK